MLILSIILWLYVGVAGEKGKPSWTFVIPIALTAAIFLLAIIFYLLRRTKGITFPSERLIIITKQQDKKRLTRV